MAAEIFRINTWVGSSVDLVAAVRLANVLLFNSDISSIDYEVLDITPDTPDPLSLGSIALSAMLATPVAWGRDSVGYTFIYTIPGTHFPTAGHAYRVIVTFRTSAALGSKPFILVWEVTTLNPET